MAKALKAPRTHRTERLSRSSPEYPEMVLRSCMEAEVGGRASPYACLKLTAARAASLAISIDATSKDSCNRSLMREIGQFKMGCFAREHGMSFESYEGISWIACHTFCINFYL